jgi:pimeloyl-ACP methyl ester carboxylesterase
MIKWVLVCFALIVAVLSALYPLQNKEQGPVDDIARAGKGGKFIRLSQGVTHYELTGADTTRTVVLLCGASVPYYLWDPTRDSLVAAGFRVLRYDYYGRGLSDRPNIPFSLATLDAQLVELLDSLHIEGKVDVAGNSMGGVVASYFASNHPNRVRTLTLVDPAFNMLDKTPFPMNIRGVGEYAAVLMVPTMAKRQLDAFHRPERYPDWPDRWREQMRYDGFRRSVLSMVREDALKKSPSDFSHLGKSGLPILLVWGRDDRMAPYSRSDTVRAAFPAAEFHVIDSSGHIPQYETPGAFAPLMIRFLRGH